MKKILCVVCFFGFLNFAFSQNQDSVQVDSIIVHTVEAFRYNDTYTKRISSAIDTSIDVFHEFEPHQPLSEYHVNLGYFGSPSFSLTNPQQFSSHFFIQPFYERLFLKDNMNQYIARKPYTTFTYSSGDLEQQHISFIHTQNYSKDLNVGIRLRYYKSNGEYSNQVVSGRHISPWFSYTGDMYSIHGMYAFNYLSHDENGGLIRDSLIEYPLSMIMNLSDAHSEKKYQEGELVQKWNLGSRSLIPDTSRVHMPHYSQAFGHALSFEKSDFVYIDNDIPASYYPAILFDSTKTHDTILVSHLTNTLFYEFSENGERDFVAHVGIGHTYSFDSFRDYLNEFPDKTYNSFFYEGYVLYETSMFDIDHTHDIVLAGYFAGDYNSHTTLSRSDFMLGNHANSIEIQYDVSRQTPEGILEHFQSNHVVWDTDFEPVFSQKIGGTLSSDFENISLSASLLQINNMVYLSDDLDLQQLSSRTFVTQFEIRKKTHLWRFVLDNRAVFQRVESHALDLPEWISYNAVYYSGKVFKNLIETHIGFDFMWFSKYNAPSYIPSLSVFAYQNNQEIGHYPITQIFVSLKYKPVRISLKYKGLYSALVEKNFLFPHYPQQSGSLSFALSWFFFN
jgi:hypothetical protein